MGHHNTRQGGRGFTIIEVLIAVVVSAVGFAAIFSMQIASMQGNIAAREMGAAVNLAERHAEQLRADAFMWTGLQRPAGRLSAAASRWHTMTDVVGGRDGVPVDHNGRPHASADDDGTPLARQRFCVHYWYEPLGALYDGILNARVRVIWPRDTLNAAVVAEACTRAGAGDFAPDVSRYMTVTVPVTIRRHPR